MSFVIRGLDPAPFRALYGLDEVALAARNARRLRSDDPAGYPCRVTLADVEPGANVLLLNHEHQPAATPFRGTHAIFVREGVERAAEHVDRVPPMLASRLLSLRAFDAEGMMVDGDVVAGAELAPLAVAWLARPEVAYLHAHFARRGCFAARIDRV